jgi:hypothetical protein
MFQIITLVQEFLLTFVVQPLAVLSGLRPRHFARKGCGLGSSLKRMHNLPYGPRTIETESSRRLAAQ